MAILLSLVCYGIFAWYSVPGVPQALKNINDKNFKFYVDNEQKTWVISALKNHNLYNNDLILIQSIHNPGFLAEIRLYHYNETMINYLIENRKDFLPNK